MRCSSWSLDPSPHRPTTAEVCPRRGAVIAFTRRGCVRNPTHGSLLVPLLYPPRTAAAFPGFAQGVSQLYSTSWDGTERNEDVHGRLFRSSVGIKTCVSPSRTCGFASQISTNDNISHMQRHNSVLVRSKCPPPSTVMSISIKQDFICARSVGLFGRVRSDTCSS